MLAMEEPIFADISFQNNILTNAMSAQRMKENRFISDEKTVLKNGIGCNANLMNANSQYSIEEHICDEEEFQMSISDDEMIDNLTLEATEERAQQVYENNLTEPATYSRTIPITKINNDDKIATKTEHFGENSSSRLTLNVGGVLFETFESTLATHPNTLLGDRKKRMKYYDDVTRQYIFERDIISFDAILFYYQSSGILSKPPNIDPLAFADELEFFEIHSAKNSKERIISHRLSRPRRRLSYRKKPKMMLNKLFNYPFSSVLSSAIAYLTILVTITNAVEFCVETLPKFRPADKKGCFLENSPTNSKYDLKNKDQCILASIEIICMALFNIDFFIRIYIARNRLNCVFSYFGIIDIASLAPFYLSLLLSQHNIPKGLQTILFLLRQLRVLQVFRLARYSFGFRALLRTVSKSLYQLGSFIIVIPMMSMLFASISYFAEGNLRENCDEECQNFSGISDWFWYSVITLTTVGYGDVYPKTVFGKLNGAVCALFGVVLFCLLTPIIFRNFVESYYVQELMSPDITTKKRQLAEKVRKMYYDQIAKS